MLDKKRWCWQKKIWITRSHYGPKRIEIAPRHKLLILLDALVLDSIGECSQTEDLDLSMFKCGVVWILLPWKV